ncbi:MAG: imidazole glycerol phosphate synthase subunit HisH [Bdellovibrionales bacterium]
MIAIVDSGGANLASVIFAIERLNAAYVFTSDAGQIRKASHVILPGVGAAGSAMRTLRQKGLVECLQNLTQPVLGICLGMQLLFAHSEEGGADMLGIMPATITKFDDTNQTVPHTGWNNVSQVRQNPLFKGLADNAYFYFVHSFYAPEGAYTAARTEYGVRFSSIVASDNFFGCQFHPERSGAAGAQLLQNFVRL